MSQLRGDANNALSILRLCHHISLGLVSPSSTLPADYQGSVVRHFHRSHTPSLLKLERLHLFQGDSVIHNRAQGPSTPDPSPQ